MNFSSPLYKIVLIGNAGVGKTSLIHSLIQRQFVEGFHATVGSSVHDWTAHTSQGDIELKIWDTAGQERYRSLAPISFRDAHAAIIVFDASFESSPDDEVNEWIASFHSTSGSDTPVYIVANKIDMVDQIDDSETQRDMSEKRKSVTTFLNRLAEEHSCKVFTTSAKNGDNVLELFEDIAKTVAQRHPSFVMAYPVQTGGNNSKCC
ncbi:Vacuolar protein sorting-associated protein 21 [Tritrichomonas foetus]|uniref:Vacuolar protein sorting-associated protein 21 n=1 Tax=Tritrichomonas foetus TaxID=1144522 RepID=A0A1J4JIR6_9EUKA|nr:Vacuolar protein sorting-associated protein 21 [Tritrichomonas foetus]|eukprot:OHS97437.1 Vacuolar protein sorting-associated protein 21 [Tritrichomonas foetus]